MEQCLVTGGDKPTPVVTWLIRLLPRRGAVVALILSDVRTWIRGSKQPQQNWRSKGRFQVQPTTAKFLRIQQRIMSLSVG